MVKHILVLLYYMAFLYTISELNVNAIGELIKILAKKSYKLPQNRNFAFYVSIVVIFGTLLAFCTNGSNEIKLARRSCLVYFVNNKLLFSSPV